MPRKLTDDQVDLFHQNGYLRIGKILGDDEIVFLRDEYDRELRRAEERGDAYVRDTEKAAGLGTTLPSRFVQITQLSERNIHFRRLLHDPRMLDVVEDLIGPNIILFEDQLLYKPPLVGGRADWHQDNGYWKCRPATLVSCWMTFDDVVRESGAMQVIPGSHTHAIPHYRFQEDDILLKLREPVDEGKALVVDLPAGGIMIHHCLTLHYTAPNTTERHRRAWAMHFMQPGTAGLDYSVAKEGKWVDRFPIDFHHPALRMRV